MITEKEIFELIKDKHRIKGLTYGGYFVLGAIILFLIGEILFALACLAVSVYFFIQGSSVEKDYIKNPKLDPLYRTYDSEETMYKVMDEIIKHPIYSSNKIKISEHFILFGDNYEKIIRYEDVIWASIRKDGSYVVFLYIRNRFGEFEDLKLPTEAGNLIYNQLLEKCDNLKSEDTINEEYDKRELPFTEEYAFYEGKKQKENKKKIEEEPVEKEEKPKKKSSTKKEKEKKEDSPKKEAKKEANDKFKELRELKALLDDGVLTQEEYENEKSKILKG
ncbi:MAG: SHOCT domain-containing protein [Bacilli bacterium]|nr:SHOCT domain-containing protein [Bacilli bacterium]